MVEVLKERRAVAAQRLITIRVAMGKLSPLMMKMFHQFTVFFFLLFFPPLSLFIYILLYFLSSANYEYICVTTIYNVIEYLLNLDKIFSYIDNVRLHFFF